MSVVSQNSAVLAQGVTAAEPIKFFPVAFDRLKSYKTTGKYNEFTADKSKLTNFFRFVKNPEITFSEITICLLEEFKDHLIGKGLSERTAVNHWSVIRSVFSYGIKRFGVDRDTCYPFGKGKILIEFPESNKIGLTQEEIQRLERIELPAAHHDHARNLWLIAFYFAGMRVSDLLRLKWSDFQDGRLYYVMGKNKKAGHIITPDKAWEIILKYKDQRRNENDYIFPELKHIDKAFIDHQVKTAAKRKKAKGNEDDIFDKLKEIAGNEEFYIERQIAFTASRVDKILRKHVAPAVDITKRLTMHEARHAFGNNAGGKISLQLLQVFYRHATPMTTINYQRHFIHEEADNALLGVVNFTTHAAAPQPPVQPQNMADIMAAMQAMSGGDVLNPIKVYMAFLNMLKEINAPLPQAPNSDYGLLQMAG